MADAVEAEELEPVLCHTVHPFEERRRRALAEVEGPVVEDQDGTIRQAPGRGGVARSTEQVYLPIIASASQVTSRQSYSRDASASIAREVDLALSKFLRFRKSAEAI